jgi:hypothetical protein
MKFSWADGHIKMWRFSDVSGLTPSSSSGWWQQQFIELCRREILKTYNRIYYMKMHVVWGMILCRWVSGCLPNVVHAYSQLKKIHSCCTLLMLEEVGWECIRKVGTHAPHNTASYHTQEMIPQKQRCPNFTRTEVYPQTDDNQCFQRKKSSCLTGNTTAATTNTTTWSLSIIFIANSYVLNDRSPHKLSFWATGGSIQNLEIQSRLLRLNSTRITVIIIDHVLNTIQRSVSEESIIILFTNYIALTHKAWLVHRFFENSFSD